MSAATTVELEARPARYAAAGLVAAGAVHAFAGGPSVSCPFRAITGLPCPFCGMTRGIAAALHGDVGHALWLNPGSVLLLAGAAVVLAAWRWQRTRIPIWAPFALVATMWAFELFKYATNRPV